MSLAENLPSRPLEPVEAIRMMERDDRVDQFELFETSTGVGRLLVQTTDGAVVELSCTEAGWIETTTLNDPEPELFGLLCALPEGFETSHE